MFAHDPSTRSTLAATGGSSTDLGCRWTGRIQAASPTTEQLAFEAAPVVVDQRRPLQNLTPRVAGRSVALREREPNGTVFRRR